MIWLQALSRFIYEMGRLGIGFPIWETALLTLGNMIREKRKGKQGKIDNMRRKSRGC